MSNNYLEWYPPDGGAMVTFGTGKAAEFRLASADGLEPVDVTSVAIKSPGQPGETALDVVVPPRVVVLQGYVQAVDLVALWASRRVLSRALTSQPVRPLGTLSMGRLRLYRQGSTTLELDCRVRSVKLPQPKGSVGVIGFDVEFYAPNPYWREVVDTTAQFAAEAGGFEWPLELSAEFTSDTVEQEIDNMGDVDASVIVRLYGECTNPRMVNVTYDETVQLIGALTADEYFEISTAFGGKTIEKVTISTGARANVFSQLDLTSILWSLRPGVNAVRFEADTSVSGRADLRWRQRYSGV